MTRVVGMMGSRNGGFQMRFQPNSNAIRSPYVPSGKYVTNFVWRPMNTNRHQIGANEREPGRRLTTQDQKKRRCRLPERRDSDSLMIHL